MIPTGFRPTGCQLRSGSGDYHAGVLQPVKPAAAGQHPLNHRGSAAAALRFFENEKRRDLDR